MTDKYTRVRVRIRKLYYFFKKFFHQTAKTIFSRMFRVFVIEPIPKQAYAESLRYLFDFEKDILLARIGGVNDGGYLCPPNIEKIKYVFSPGYGGIKNFEDEMTLLGKKVFLCDPAWNFVENLQELQEFDNFGIASQADPQQNLISFGDWLENKVHKSETDFLLQIDIEGEEWDIFAYSNKEILRRFEIILTEFHGLDRVLFDPAFADKVKLAISNLKLNFVNVYCRANNSGGWVYFNGQKFPKVIECTFIRRDSMFLNEKVGKALQHDESDFINNPNLPPLFLPKLDLNA